MNGDIRQQKVLITNPQGFHMRPISAFAQLAGRYQSTITVTKDGRRVNGKSPLELMFLAAEQGSELLLEANGPDADDAIAALVQLLKELPPEDPAESPLPQKG